MTIFVGTTIEDAKAVAKRQLKPTDNQELQVKVVQEPRHGFLGIGRRAAKIDVTITERKPAAPAKPVKKQPAGKQPQKKQSAAPTMKENTSKPTDTRPVNDGELDPAEIKRRHQANIDRVQTAGLLLVGYLRDVCAKLGIEVQPRIVEAQAHEIKVDLKSDMSGKIIGRHGRRINALEQLSNTFMDYHGAPKTTVILDTSNYRERRAEAVKSLAERSVMEVVASGQAVFLDPMPARERKLIHQTLEGNDHVKTYSHGREPYRSVVIAPKN